MYPESWWSGLRVVANETLLVEEGSRAALDGAILKVEHPQLAPEDITYTLVKRPHHGVLELDPQGTNVNEVLDDSSIHDHQVGLNEQMAIFD